MSNPVQIIIQGVADFGSIQEEFQKLGEKSNSAFAAISKGAQAFKLLGEAFAAERLIEMAKEFSDEWIRATKGVAQLEAAMRSTGQASEDYRQQLEEQRKAISAATGAEEDQLVVIQRHLVQYKASRDQIKELTQLSLDLAASQGMDGASAAALLSKALGGEEVQLRGVRLELDRTLPKYEQINSMIRQLQGQVGGQAEAAFLAGGPAITMLDNKWIELKKQIGEGLTVARGMAAANILFQEQLARSAFNTLVPDRIQGQYRALMDRMSGKRGLEETDDERAKRESADLEAQKIHDKKMGLLDLQTQAGLAAGAEPSNQATLENQRAFNETQYSLGKRKLKEYLAERLRLIGEEAKEETKIINLAIGANAEATDKKKAELDAVKAGTNLEQIEKVQQEYDKLLIDGNKLANQLKAVEAKQLTGLDNERKFGAENPTTIAGGIQKGWVDTVKELGTVYTNLGSTISKTVGTAISGVSQGITGLITGTLTWGQALRNIGTSILNVVIDGIVKMFAAWITGRQAASLIEIASTEAENAGKFIGALLTAVTSYGAAAVVGAAAFTAALGVGIAAAAGAFADGGRPEVGQVALVGERGPELFVPDTAGTIIPAHVTSSILNGNSSTGSQSRRRSEGLKTIQMHAWFDKAEMTKHIQNNPEAQHAILEVVGKNSHLIMR